MHKFDIGPTKGVRDPGTIKRPPHQGALESLSDSGRRAEADDYEEDDIGQIGTHRQQSITASQNELAPVNRYGTGQKN